MTILLLQMNRLPSDVKTGFNDGLFVAKLSDSKFNDVWIDYVLEATEHKTLKGVGGIIGLTLKGNALARWFLARPVTAKYSMEFQVQMHLNATISTTRLPCDGLTQMYKRWYTCLKEVT
jgi:hypothetical protein